MKNIPTESKLCWTTAGFVPLSTTGIWGWVVLGREGLPRAGKMQSPYPPDDSYMHPLSRDHQMVSRHCQMSPGEQNHPWLRTTRCKLPPHTF